MYALGAGHQLGAIVQVLGEFVINPGVAILPTGLKRLSEETIGQ